MNDPVLVTTEYRGVFFGDLLEYNGGARTAKLRDARNCIAWSQDVRGVFGLAAIGPTKGCRIGPKVPSILLEKVTSVVEMTAAAVEAWETEPWS